MRQLFKVELVDEDGGPVETIKVVADDGEEAVKAAKQHARSDRRRGRLMLGQLVRMEDVDVVA